jgi:hypothetical protein
MCIVKEPRISADMWAEAAALAKAAEQHCDLTREEVITLVWAEYLYWRGFEIPVHAAGVLANIIGQIAISKTHEDPPLA